MGGAQAFQIIDISVDSCLHGVKLINNESLVKYIFFIVKINQKPVNQNTLNTEKFIKELTVYNILSKKEYTFMIERVSVGSFNKENKVVFCVVPEIAKIIRIKQVKEGSPAAAEKLSEGDVLVAGFFKKKLFYFNGVGSLSHFSNTSITSEKDKESNYVFYDVKIGEVKEINFERYKEKKLGFLLEDLEVQEYNSYIEKSLNSNNKINGFVNLDNFELGLDLGFEIKNNHDDESRPEVLIKELPLEINDETIKNNNLENNDNNNDINTNNELNSNNNTEPNNKNLEERQEITSSEQSPEYFKGISTNNDFYIQIPEIIPSIENTINLNLNLNLNDDLNKENDEFLDKKETEEKEKNCSEVFQKKLQEKEKEKAQENKENIVVLENEDILLLNNNDVFANNIYDNDDDFFNHAHDSQFENNLELAKISNTNDNKTSKYNFSRIRPQFAKDIPIFKSISNDYKLVLNKKVNEQLEILPNDVVNLVDIENISLHSIFNQVKRIKM